jgi:hypothetical protein
VVSFDRIRLIRFVQVEGTFADQAGSQRMDHLNEVHSTVFTSACPHVTMQTR